MRLFIDFVLCLGPYDLWLVKWVASWNKILIVLCYCNYYIFIIIIIIIIIIINIIIK